MAAKHRSLARVAGLDVETLSKLEGHNFRTAEDVLTRSSLDLVELLDISLPAAERVFQCVAKNVCPKPTTAKALLASRAGGTTTETNTTETTNKNSNRTTGEPGPSSSHLHLQQQQAGPAYVRGGVFLHALDQALGGGVPTGSITELVGGAGAGKTQFCLTLAVATAAPLEVGGLNAGVVYIDTEQKFSGVRLCEIASSVFPAVYARVATDSQTVAQQKAQALLDLTQRVLILTPSTLSETYQRLQGLEETFIDHGVRLLVIDSVAALARAEFGVGSGQLARRQELLGQIASVLKQQAERLHMAAFVTNQVTTTFGRKRGGGEGGGFNGRDNGGHGRERDFTNNDETDFEGHGDGGVGSTTAALGVKWAHCVNTRLVLEGASEGHMETAGAGGDGTETQTQTQRNETNAQTNGGEQNTAGTRVVKVVKSPRCALVGYEYQIWRGGVKVLGDRKVRVHPSGGAADGAIRGIFNGL